MSELDASSGLLSVLLNICFSFLSHPLYFSYFIFFFPYLLSLLAFLFPLLATIVLLLLALYTLSPALFYVEHFDSNNSSESKVGVFLTFQYFFDDFEACKYEDGGHPDEVLIQKYEDNAESFLPGKIPPLMKDVEENKDPGNIQNSEFKRIEVQKEKLCPNEAEDDINSGSGPSKTKSMEEPEALGLSVNGVSGSMRREKEWRRTLACKLYEERHTVGEGSEGMDLLWETYENESNAAERIKNRRSSLRKCKNGGFERAKKEEETVEDEDSTGNLCCLQAFKLSAGKMNLGMGRTNFVKFSKALKGIGWFHQVKIKHVRKSSSLN